MNSEIANIENGSVFSSQYGMATRAQTAWNKIALLTICDAARRVNPAPVTNIVLHKHLFLVELEGRKQDVKAAYYRFFRYNNGPFSSGLSWDIAEFENLGLVDSETGELLERGRYLLDYVSPELKKDALTPTVEGVIRKISEGWKDYRGWSIAEAVYGLKVPVDELGRRVMTVKEIPFKTDILVPEWSHEREFQPFPADLIDDIYSELSIPASHLDPESEELRTRAAASLEAALARS